MNSDIITVYKKVNLYKDGTLHPLFIDTKRPFTIGEWMHCEYHPTKGFMPRSVVNNFDENPTGGWHCCFSPIAPHLADELKSGQKRVWLKCEAKGLRTIYERPWNQGGSWILVEWIKPVSVLTDEEVLSSVSQSEAV